MPNLHRSKVHVDAVLTQRLGRKAAQGACGRQLGHRRTLVLPRPRLLCRLEKRFERGPFTHGSCYH